MDNQFPTPQSLPPNTPENFTTSTATFMHPYSYKSHKKISSAIKKSISGFEPALCPNTNIALIKRGRPKNDELFSNYLNALSEYCDSYKLPCPPIPILLTPHNLFYSKNKEIYFVFPLQLFGQMAILIFTGGLHQLLGQYSFQL